MLKMVEETNVLELTEQNPCFTIETDDLCEMHVHVYRKGSKNETVDCYMDFPEKSSCVNPCRTLVECPSFDEWHTVEGQYKRVCLSHKVFHAGKGIWTIDVYKDFEYLGEGHQDPTNLYREIDHCGKVGKKICKTYEFYVGDPCGDVKATVCTTD